ncbi:MAG TPA: hypothetical protein DCY88_17780 [Cyanobacteria bacterium UBA11372]|nr:hypothetical protein [Cyanobacteria bacterium UBA11372]
MIANNQSPTIEKFKSESELKSYLVNDALTKYSSLFGQKTGGIGFLDSINLVPNQGSLTGNIAEVVGTTDATNSNSFTTVTGIANTGVSESFVQSSSTNTQEQGVDEADLVETDGKFIYEVVGKTLTIVDARNSQQLNIASQTDLSSLGNIEGAYLQGNRLTVISNDWSWGLPLAKTSSDSIPTLSGPKVNVTVFNVSDPKSVKIEEKSQLEGSLLTSRAINDQVYVVTTQTGFGLPGPKLVPGPPVELPKLELTTNPGTPLTKFSSKAINFNLSQPAISSNISPLPSIKTYTYAYETKEQYLARIQGQELKLALPDFTTVDGQGQLVRSGQLSQATNIYKPLDNQPYQVANVSVFDVDDGKPGPDFSTGIPTSYLDKAYMSSDNLYLLGTNWQDWSNLQTKLLKVDLNPLELVATGDAPGQVNNQFSVDEHKDFLRVATTTGSGWNSKNNLYVLQQQGQKLDIVGRLEGLAPGETIRSARLMDDYGFMVTFREVDPFFTLDLRQPTNPQLAGELKLPGFSQYLQVIESQGKQLVLGIGQDRDPLTGMRTLKVSLFDVTDIKNPKEVESFLFEGQYASSEAQWDHHAVSYFPGSDILAIPYQKSWSEQGLRVFHVDGVDGLTVLGDIKHQGEPIRRSLRIGNDLYAISDKQVTAYNLGTLQQVGQVVLPGSDSNGFGGLIGSGSFPVSPVAAFM